MEFCDGMEWTILDSLEIRGSKTRNASRCWEIAQRYNSSQRNGPYWIKPAEGGPTFKVSALKYNGCKRNTHLINFFCIARLDLL